LPLAMDEDDDGDITPKDAALLRSLGCTAVVFAGTAPFDLRVFGLLLLLVLLTPSLRGTIGDGRNPPPLFPPPARYQAGPSFGKVDDGEEEDEEEGLALDAAAVDDALLILF
jgi:hypothetical protein